MTYVRAGLSKSYPMRAARSSEENFGIVLTAPTKPRGGANRSNVYIPAFVRAFASDHYTVPLPAAHPFPMAKYRAVREALESDGTLPPGSVADPGLVSPEAMSAAHDPDWVSRILEHRIEREMERRIGLPVGGALERRARAAAAGTLAASRAALEHGVASNLAGGTHHAGPAHGAGFCVINDLAICAKVLLGEGRVSKVAIIDLDVHQGDGTAAILGGDPRIYTFSMHGARNFPKIKIPSCLDVDLPDGTRDEEFLQILDLHLDRILDTFEPGLVLYQSGVDPLMGDRFGRLALSVAGLRERDRRVLEAAAERGIPVATVMGGGYGRDVSQTILAHTNTVREAHRVFDSSLNRFRKHPLFS